MSDILRQIIKNGRIYNTKKTAEFVFNITLEQLLQFQYSTTPISISKIAKRINDLIDMEQMIKSSYKQLIDWLLSIGLLTERTDASGKVSKCPTSNDEQLGISVNL